MGSIASPKPHAVLVPYPAQGHVSPLMQLGKLLHSRGFHITFVNTEHNHRRLIRSRGQEFINGLPDFKFKAIPDGLPPTDRDATQHVPSLCDSTRKNCLAPFKELIAKLKASTDVPPITCIISDGVMAFAIDAARHFGIPEFQFWTASAGSFMAYLHHVELVRRGIVPFKDESFMHDGTLNQPVDFIPGMPNLKLRDMPSFIRVTDVNDIMFDFIGSEAHRSLKADAIIFNTFDEFEQEVLDAIAAMYPKIYTIGPFTLLEKGIPEGKSKAFRSSLWKEDLSCLEWLDKREPDSVVYVNYGCVTTITDKQLIEFAWGLANSKHPFLWIVRPDIVMGESAVLPEEFYEEIKDRGLLVNWVPQDRVLQHPSVGVFLSHCGWNSTMECVSGGKPLICWPFFGEQQTNCKYACDVWKTGMELSTDLTRDELVGIIKELMETEKGKEMKRNAVEWRKKAEAATSIGGVSYNNFDRFIKEAILQEKSE
ncbi:linamarin synthase 2-like [Hevea brasiliensis]|uniref:linamarin synthase 2-like n=1 Tax=Hevea brasiliensis TaxID=3981 RepID=UPI0025EA3835|nr:linamarin synthase 2-like [Hevea brasiliensis]